MDGGCTIILDSRTIAQLGKETLSGYSRLKVKTALRDSLCAGRTEAACYWAAELLCSFRPEDVWEEFISFYALHINLASTTLPIYLSERASNFKDIAMSEDNTGLRNNYDVRRIFAEVTGVLSMSRRRNSLHSPYKLSASDFAITSLSSKLRAKRPDLSADVTAADDPGDIHIPINELMYHLTSPVGDLTLACFWVDWLIAYIIAAKKAKQPLFIAEREWVTVSGQLKQHPIWLVWHCCRVASQTRNRLTARVVDSLCNIFSLRFRDSSPTRRRHLIYTAIAFVIDGTKKPVPICANAEHLASVKNRIDLVYKQIKSQERRPETTPPT